MDTSDQLVVAMTEECRRIIDQWQETESDLPNPIRRAHLLMMCDRIERHAEHWPTSKLNRWIGFIQCALIANRVIDLSEAKRMFDRAKIAFPESDEDLLDHLNPSDSFGLDIGGPG